VSYLQINGKCYIAQFFEINPFGLVASNCEGEKRYSNCVGEHVGKIIIAPTNYVLTCKGTIQTLMNMPAIHENLVFLKYKQYPNSLYAEARKTLKCQNF